MLPTQPTDSSRKTRSYRSSDRACLQCQRRKTKCTGGGDARACSYCSKARRSCVFIDNPSRTPLTRANLDAAESRCQKLEFLLNQIGADFDIDAALETSPRHDEAKVPEPMSTNAFISSTRPSGDATPIIDYEWNERLPSGPNKATVAENMLKDGMASLTASGHSSGYLGNSSGSCLLESISSLLTKSNAGATRHQIPGASSESSLGFELSFSGLVANSSVHDHLIEAYFVGFNRSYPILHERTFRDRYQKRAQVNARSSWHIISYMVLAIGEWICGWSGDDTSLYYEAARSRLRFEMLESGTIGIVQAFLLLGNYLQKRDRPNTGYNFIGIAYRVALGLGLHREIATSNGKESFSQHRRRVLFWILYCFESGFSITTGRPNIISDAFIDARKPGNIDDSNSDALSALPEEVDHPTTYSAIIAQARLAVIANKIYNGFLSTHKYDSDVNDHTAAMEQILQVWRNSLPAHFWAPDCPPWFRGPRQILLWKEANLHTLLLLASQRHQAEEHDKILASSKCQYVAAQTIFDIASFCRKHLEVVHTGISWYAVYFLLQATLALGVHSLERSRSNFPTFERNNVQVTWESAVSQALDCLELLGRTNKIALRSLHVLNRLREQVDSSLSHLDPISHGPPGPMQDSDEQPPQNLGSDAISVTVGSASTASSTVPLQPPPETSPEGLDAAMDFSHLTWMGSVDPSLHMFFDSHNDGVSAVFNNVHGFPSIMEQEYFGYVTSSMQPSTDGASLSDMNSWENDRCPKT